MNFFIKGYESCILVGHDWGGTVAWYVAAKNPEVVEKLVLLNSAHPSAFDEQRKVGGGLAQFLKSWYANFIKFTKWNPDGSVGIAVEANLLGLRKKCGYILQHIHADLCK